MIQIPGIGEYQLASLPLSDLQRRILRQRQASPVVYRFVSLDALLFELTMRENIVRAATDMFRGGANFAIFERSRCNPMFWTRTPNGGFQLDVGVSPSTAIRDIFINGRMYAFECATAMIIILYKAVLDTIGDALFNTHFKNLYIRDWHYDSDMRLVTKHNKNEATLGDILYFKNPDFNPRTPEWQGENAIMLGDDQFFGHGIGIRSAERMIAALNTKRRPGSFVSAYQTEQVNYPSFEHLRALTLQREEPLGLLQDDDSIVVLVGNHYNIFR